MDRLVIGERATPSLQASSSTQDWSWTDLAAGELEELSERPGVNEELLARSAEMSLIPSATVQSGDLLLVLHSLDQDGHLLQLGIVASDKAVTTVHASFDKSMDPEKLTRETRAVRAGLLDGRIHATEPEQLVALLVERIISSLEELLLEVAGRSGRLDRRIREESRFDSEGMLEELFTVRHDLFTVFNRLRQNALTLQAVHRLRPGVLSSELVTLERLVQVCDGERDFFQGVLDYYEQRVSIKMNFAMERLAVVTVIVLPVTAISGILGMNTITTDQTRGVYTAVVVLLMGAMVGALLHWTKKKNWW